ncbi:hypothetical protein CC80DRAFT_492375 [Byssothecium circinans]|uniref:mRNA export factor GLE1 n=1 Tax=Byssothecium circinans TaxID=147558 RepID=A0A6A5TTV0_9PLEO|nr:hypothetical protein CC80DRAFT_492375 [Byssothecium circinans]
MPARSGASSSSMNTSTSFTSSWLNGSPSRQSPQRNGMRSSRGSLILNESPSRQMQLEFNMLLSRSDRDFHDKLDQAAAERARIADEQLAKAAQEHLRVQEGAKLEIQRIILEQEQENQRREEAQRREVEKLRIEKAKQEAEAQRQRLDAKRKEEEIARQAAEHQRQLQEADARAKAQQQQAAQRQKEEADRKAKEAAAAQEKARIQAQPPPTAPVPAKPVPAVPSTTTTSTTATSAPAPDAEELHRKYMELHARMKKFRTEFYDQVKQKDHPLKAPVGDARRTIRLNLGQTNGARSTTTHAINQIREKCFDIAVSTPGPVIDIRPYLVSRQVQLSDAEARYPAFLLYLWICFGKSVIAQWKSEAANQDSVVPQEIGLLTSSLYADKRYMCNGTIPMVDLMLAKLHRKCPMLFGIRGNTTTTQGLVRLGLDKYRDDENEYAQLMTGIGAGFASITLRQFARTTPVFDMAEYWRAVVNIINTPASEIYPGHLFALQGLLREFAPKFITYYGAPARAILKRATKTFPDRAPKGRPGVAAAAELIKVLPDTWKQKNKIVI